MDVKTIFERAMAGEQAPVHYVWCNSDRPNESTSSRANVIECFASDGSFVGAYPTLEVASQFTGINPTLISRCVNGKIPHAGRKEKYTFKRIAP